MIWREANLLRGDYRQSEYGKVILPMTMLRRLDYVLKHTKQKVLKNLPKVKDLPDEARYPVLNREAGNNFYNQNAYDFDKKKSPVLTPKLKRQKINRIVGRI